MKEQQASFHVPDINRIFLRNKKRAPPFRNQLFILAALADVPEFNSNGRKRNAQFTNDCVDNRPLCLNLGRVLVRIDTRIRVQPCFGPKNVTSW